MTRYQELAEQCAVYAARIIELERKISLLHELHSGINSELLHARIENIGLRAEVADLLQQSAHSWQAGHEKEGQS